MYPRVPEVYPRVPKVYPRVLKVYPRVPEVFPRVPELYPRVPEVYPRFPNRAGFYHGFMGTYWMCGIFSFKDCLAKLKLPLQAKDVLQPIYYAEQ